MAKSILGKNGLIASCDCEDAKAKGELFKIACSGGKAHKYAVIPVGDDECPFCGYYVNYIETAKAEHPLKSEHSFKDVYRFYDEHSVNLLGKLTE